MQATNHQFSDKSKGTRYSFKSEFGFSVDVARRFSHRTISSSDGIRDSHNSTNKGRASAISLFNLLKVNALDLPGTVDFVTLTFGCNETRMPVYLGYFSWNHSAAFSS